MDTLDGEALQNADQFSVKEENADQFSVKEENADQFSVKEENADWFCIKEEKLVVDPLPEAKHAMDNCDRDDVITIIDSDSIKKEQTPEVDTKPVVENAASTNRETIKCEFCSATFTFRTNFQRHVSTIHMHVKRKKSHSCNFCGKTFVEKNCLIAHHALHTGMKEFLCKLCNRPFSTKRYLVRHNRRVHLGKKPNIPEVHCCSVCSKQYARKRDLNVHIRNKHSSVNLDAVKKRCEFCDKLIFAKSMNQHYQTHLLEKQFKCDLCGKSFSRKYLLTKHFSKHTGKAEFQCDVCKKRFATKGMLKRHLKHHNVS